MTINGFAWELSMTILVADEGLLGLTELVPSHCEIRWYSGRDVPQSILKGADALLVRSTARVSAHNLPDSLRFVGTATIGTDHLPLQYLLDRAIRVVSAPGCNAFAVTDYVLSHVFSWAKSRERNASDLTLGILVLVQWAHCSMKRARALGIKTLLSDQPRADSGTTRSFAVELMLFSGPMLYRCMCHVTTGDYVTDRLLDENLLSQIKRHAFIGECIARSGFA